MESSRRIQESQVAQQEFKVEEDLRAQKAVEFKSTLYQVDEKFEAEITGVKELSKAQKTKFNMT